MAHESSRAGPCWAGNYMLDGMKLATGLAVSAEQGSEEGSLELLCGKCVKKNGTHVPSVVNPTQLTKWIQLFRIALCATRATGLHLANWKKN